MISWLDAKISLNYLCPVPEIIILVFCCQINHWHSRPHRNYLGEQLTLLVCHWLVLEALYTFTNIYYGSGTDLLDLFIDFSHISLFTMLFQAFWSSEDEPFTSFFKEWDQPSLSASSSVPSAAPYLGFHSFLACAFPTDKNLFWISSFLWNSL